MPQKGNHPKSPLTNCLILGNRLPTSCNSLWHKSIRPIPNIASTGRINGFSFEYNGIAFKASQLGKGYSWSALQSRIDYQQERDNAFLFKLKSTVRETFVGATHDMVITIDAPETTTEYVNRPIEALILDKRAAGQDEYSIASVEALLPEAVATNKEAIATETLKSSAQAKL